MEDLKDMEKQPYVLTDLENLGHLQSPLKSTQRIKYTCFGLSKKFLVFGATSGGLYIFKREPCSFLQLIPSKDGALSHVAVSPDERVVAYATSKGLVVLVELQAAQQGGGARRLQVSQEHLGNQVTALQWSCKGDELYAGDTQGKVSLCCVSLFSAKNIFQTLSLQLMQLDSSVVQMDYQHELLLISTLTRCYVSDTTKEQYKQVGQKLRDGEYGACFLCLAGEAQAPPPQGEEPNAPHVTASQQFDLLAAHESLVHQTHDLRVFCARPGSRLWEVRGDGTVLSTHQFRQAIATTPPAQLITNKTNQERRKTSNNTQDADKHSFNFAKLYPISNKFIFTFKSNGIYILDPDNAEIILWNNEFQGIIDAKIFNDTIYVWLSSGEMHALTLCLIEKCIMRLYFRKQYALCAQLCSLHMNHLSKRIPASRKLHFLVDLGDKLKDLGLLELQQNILPLISAMSKIIPEKPKTQKLRSGIYLVGNNHTLESDEEDGKNGLRNFRSLSGSRSRKLTERSRSLSSSPEGRRRRKSGPKRQALCDLAKQSHSGSLHSLPDIRNSPQKHPSPTTKRNNNKLVTSHEQNGGHVRNATEDWESMYTGAYDDLFIPELPFSVLSSPETIAALRDLTQILSVKISSSKQSLRKTWHALEGKVRSLSQDAAPPAPLDVRTKDYQESAAEIPQVEQEFEILLPNGKPVRLLNKEKISETNSLPLLDINTVNELCNQIKNSICEDNQSIQEEIFTELNIICEQFVRVKMGGENGGTPWLEKSVVEAFPFSHYFKADDMQIIHESINNQLETKNIIKFCNELMLKIEFDSEFPDIFRNLYTSEELKLDTLISRIIAMYSNILDEEQILSFLIELNIPCYFLSWCSVLNHFQQDVLNFITCETRENIRKLITNKKYPLPMLLNVMYLILRVSSIEGIDICLSIGENVCIKDFCYVIIKLQQNKINSESSNNYIQRYCQNIFLTYLTKLMNSGKEVWSECINDKEVFVYTSSAFLCINSEGDQMCACGYPKLQSLRKTPLQFEFIGNMILTHYQQHDVQSYLLLCSKLGLWNKVLKYKQEQGVGIGDVLPYVMQLDCPAVLEDVGLSLSEALWCEVLQMKRSLEASTSCLKCGGGLERRQAWRLTWSRLGLALVRVLGSETACDLLMRYMPSEASALDAQFYQACIFSSIVSDFGESARLGVLNFVQRPSSEPLAFFSPQVTGAISEALSRDLALQGVSAAEVLPSEGGRDHHWGVRACVRGALCPRCALPLSDPVLLAQGGVRVFPCSHVYHLACLPKLNTTHCKLCKKA